MRFESSKSGWFTVLKESEVRDGSNKLFEIEFDEYNNVKHRTIARPYIIKTGSVKNPYFPRVCGVGYMGNSSPKDDRVIYDRWRNMINRCYNKRNNRYDSYGGNGVSVCERWFSFEYFLEDFLKLDGYDNENLSKLSLDKDSKIKGNKLYSLETCLLIDNGDNTREMNERVHQKLFTATAPTGERFVSNNQREFACKYGLSYQSISNILRGEARVHKGWKFKYN